MIGYKGLRTEIKSISLDSVGLERRVQTKCGVHGENPLS